MPIIITRADGGVSVMTVFHPEGLKAAERKKLVAAEVEKWKDAHSGEYASHAEVESLPPDRSFRAAWCSLNRQPV